MAASYQTTAHSLSVSPSRSRSSPSPSPPPAWPASSSPQLPRTSNTFSRVRASSPSDGARLSMPRIRRIPTDGPGGRAGSYLRQGWGYLQAYNAFAIRTFYRLTPLQRIFALIGVVLIYVVIILAAIYHTAIFDWLANLATSWRAMPGGWLIVFALVFVCSFPPMLGYSTALTIAGFVYGFPWGWPIVAAACVAGSLCAFLASRTILSAWVDRVVGKDARFRALGQVLRRDGIWYLTGIRFCPLPYSLSNGFLATIPSISPLSFTLATALSTRLAALAENGDKMSIGDRIINYLGMAIGGAVGIAVGWIIYKRTMARAAEIAREELVEEGHADRSAYLDTEDTLIDPEDAAALMSDDDLSLWETQIDEDARDYNGPDTDDQGKGQPSQRNLLDK